MFSACLPRREPLTADNFPSGPSAPESSRPAGAFDAPHACDASRSSLDDDGPHDRVCVIVNVRAPGAKTAVKRLKRLHGVEVLVMDSKSQERLLRRLEELLVGSDGNDARDKDDGHGAGRIRFLAGGGAGMLGSGGFGGTCPPSSEPLEARGSRGSRRSALAFRPPPSLL